jgi:hypothetical protein
LKDYSKLTDAELVIIENDLVAKLGNLEFQEITKKINYQVYRLKKTDLATDVLTLQYEKKRRQL